MATCDRCKKDVPESEIVSIPGYRICRSCDKALEQDVLGSFPVVTRFRSEPSSMLKSSPPQGMTNGIVCAVLKGGSRPAKVADYVYRIAAGFPAECWNQPVAFYPVPRDPKTEGATYFTAFLSAMFMMDEIKMDLNTLKYAFRDDTEGEAVLVWAEAQYPESLGSSAPKVPALK